MTAARPGRPMPTSSFVAGLVDLFLPAGCLRCGSWMPSGGKGLVCGPCRARCPEAPWPRCPRCHHPRGTGRETAPVCRMCAAWPDALTRARHAFVLAPPADHLVHALKYEGWAALAPEMGRSMARAPLPPAGPTERRLVVAVPTTSARIRKRGYNQARLLGEAVAGELSIPLVEGLIRTRGGATQVALHPSQRRANVRGVFAVRDEARPLLGGTHVILVDDVLTTGATAGAAATILAGAGVTEVTLLTYARALPFRRGSGV